jgi:NADPH2:quinone reductase
VPGLEVVGEVVEVAGDVTSVRVGDRVWTTMQGLGGVRAERDGGYAELVTVSANVLASSPGGSVCPTRS